MSKYLVSKDAGADNIEDLIRNFVNRKKNEGDAEIAEVMLQPS